MKNKDLRNLLISLAAGLAGIIVILTVIYLPVDIYEGGGALIMLGILLTITGPIVALLFWQRAWTYEKLMKDDNLIAKWNFDEGLWKRFMEEEKSFRQGEQRGLQLIVLFFSVLFGAIFWIADPETGWIVALVLLGVNILIMIVVWLNGMSLRRWDKVENLECRIGQNGLILIDQLHLWSGWGAKLEGAGVKKGKLNIVEITYSTPNRYSRQYYTIRIPVPSGEETKAEEVVKTLT